MKQCPKTYFIWDSNIFLSFIKEIKYFASLNLISEDDVTHLKEELYQLLAIMETLSIKGEFSEGHKVYFYLSNIDFEATYTYIEKKDYQVSLLRVYSINSMDSQSPQICQIQRNWIQSLKRHSTLISESGEAQRIEFLQKQLAIIDTLPTKTDQIVIDLVCLPLFRMIHPVPLTIVPHYSLKYLIIDFLPECDVPIHSQQSARPTMTQIRKI